MQGVNANNEHYPGNAIAGRNVRNGQEITCQNVIDKLSAHFMEQKALDERQIEELLEVLVIYCAEKYDFTSEAFKHAKSLSHLFDNIVTKWILNSNWLSNDLHRQAPGAPQLESVTKQKTRPGLILNVLQLIRLLTRDRYYKGKLIQEKKALEVLSKFMRLQTKAYFEEKQGTKGPMPLTREMLVECISIIRRLTAENEYIDEVIQVACSRSEGTEEHWKILRLSGEDMFKGDEQNIPLTLGILLHINDDAILPLALDSMIHIVHRMTTKVCNWECALNQKKTDCDVKENVAIYSAVLCQVASCSSYILVQIIERYPSNFVKLACSILQDFFDVDRVRIHILNDQYMNQKQRLFNSKDVYFVQRLLSKLSSCDFDLCVHLLQVLESILKDKRSIMELKDTGGIPILLKAIKMFPPDTNTNSQAHSIDVMLDKMCHVSDCITRIALDDEASYQVVHCNGVYLLGKCLLQPWSCGTEENAVESLEDIYNIEESRLSKISMARAHILRSLRFLFSSERNRGVFKKLMPPDFFATFIDIGHYQEAIKPYISLAKTMETSRSLRIDGDKSLDPDLPFCSEVLVWMGSSLNQINKDAKDVKVESVRGYHFLELLGKGAYGSVFKARKKDLSGDIVCAVKELDLDNSQVFGVTETEQAKAKDNITSEVQILSEVDHPNIIRYFDSFEHDKKIYIAMELAEGMTLGERIESFKARGQRFDESAVWQILMQLSLALRYLHKDKHVVHRDLTPANIMISMKQDSNFLEDLKEQDASQLHVRITDFGYAKQQSGQSFAMKSVVGTITFCCPEIVQNEEYTEKADIWSLGCVMYNVMFLHPPFRASNILFLASQIVEGIFDPPIDDNSLPYSSELKSIVSRMLIVDAKSRPSIDELICEMSTRLACETDKMRNYNHNLQKELQKERSNLKREQRSALKSQGSMERAHSEPQMSLDHLSISPASDEIFDSPRFLSTATSKISIAQRHLRVLTDPVVNMLTQVQKLVLVSQLPPSLHHDERRQYLQRFHHRLFSADQRAASIKSHLAKLISRSDDVIELRSYYPSKNDNGLNDIESTSSLTYAHLHRMLEDVLRENNSL